MLQNKHLEHLEELHPDFIMNFFEYINDYKISVKYDGSPSIVFGKDSNDEFFIGTKSVFNKVPKMAKSLEDIDQMYTGEVRNILKRAFDILCKENITSIYQADVMFVGMLSQYGFVNVQPNTLMYQINDRKVKYARIGLAIHTEYNKDLTFKCFSPSLPNLSDKIYLFDCNYTLSNFTFSEDRIINLDNRYRNIMCKIDDFFELSNKLSRYGCSFKNYTNQSIKDDFFWYREPKFFIKFVEDKLNKKIKSKKTIDKYLVKLQEYNNSKLINNYILFQSATVGLKNELLSQLNENYHNSKIKTYLNDQACSPEGYVFYDDDVMVKIVDRFMINKANFT